MSDLIWKGISLSFMSNLEGFRRFEWNTRKLLREVEPLKGTQLATITGYKPGFGIQVSIIDESVELIGNMSPISSPLNPGEIIIPLPDRVTFTELSEILRSEAFGHFAYVAADELTAILEGNSDELDGVMEALKTEISKLTGSQSADGLQTS